MASYFDEHASTDRASQPNFLLELARLLLSTEDLVELARYAASARAGSLQKVPQIYWISMLEKERESSRFDDIGSPPASREAINNLDSITITEKHLKAVKIQFHNKLLKWPSSQNDDSHKESSSSCPICLAEYEENEKVKQMPCEHMFHSGCILPWLEKTNSCPVCRYELPTDNEDYEELKKLKGREKERRHRIEALHASMFS